MGQWGKEKIKDKETRQDLTVDKTGQDRRKRETKRKGKEGNYFKERKGRESKEKE